MYYGITFRKRKETWSIRFYIDHTRGSMGIIILLAVVVVLCLISIVYKQITGKEMDFSSSKEKKESKETGIKRWLNDRKLSRRWQVAESMRLANEGKAPVKNKEDRFHITQRNEDIVESMSEKDEE